MPWRAGQDPEELSSTLLQWMTYRMHLLSLKDADSIRASGKMTSLFTIRPAILCTDANGGAPGETPEYRLRLGAMPSCVDKFMLPH